jgi:electron transport complex protein RnfE
MADRGPSAAERFIHGIVFENPVYRQLLGLCPVLAVTAAVKPAMTMALAVLFVLLASSVTINLVRPLLRPHLLLLVFLVVVAAFVTLADQLLYTFLPTMSEALGPYLPLIIVNCIVLTRCEVCASRQGLGAAIADAVGNSIGFALALASVASVREILGQGTWLGLPLSRLTSDEAGWAVMTLPPGAFLALGLLLGLKNWLAAQRTRRQRRALRAEGVAAAS